MRTKKLNNNLFISVQKSENKYRKLDYYLEFPSGEKEYLFTKNYSATCYDLCKAGLPINEVLHIKKKNEAIMKLAKYLNFMMPYFIEYLDLETIEKSRRERKNRELKCA